MFVSATAVLDPFSVRWFSGHVRPDVGIAVARTQFPTVGPPGLAGGRKETSDMRHTFLVLAASTFLAVFAGCACNNCCNQCNSCPGNAAASSRASSAAGSAGPGRRRKLSLLHDPRSARLPGNPSAEHRPVSIRSRSYLRSTTASMCRARAGLEPVRKRDGIRSNASDQAVRIATARRAKKTAACTAETCCVICHAFRAEVVRLRPTGPRVKALGLMTASSRFQATFGVWNSVALLKLKGRIEGRGHRWRSCWQCFIYLLHC